MISRGKAATAVPVGAFLLVLISVVGALARVPSAAGGASTEEMPRLFPSLSEGVFESRGMAASPSLLAQAADGEDDQMSSEDPMDTGPTPGKALLLSALLPGSGQYYAGNKTRAAVFGGVEALGWGLYLSSNAKGHDLEDEFRARADTTWHVWDYLTWLSSTISKGSNKTHALPCSSFVVEAGSAAPIGQALGGCSGSEVQQYYELIGKYDQFIAGWSDDVVNSRGDSVLYTEIDSTVNYQSATRLEYETQRDDSNKFLKRATNLAGLILVNHVFSAIDASRVARARAQGVDAATLERRIRLAFYMGAGTGGAIPMIMAYRPVY